mgnify:CR=1 FL=1
MKKELGLLKLSYQEIFALSVSLFSTHFSLFSYFFKYTTVLPPPYFRMIPSFK